MLLDPRRIRTPPPTYRDEHFERPGDGRLQVRVEHDRPELHLMPRLVDGLVRLDEHRVALVHVLQRGGVEKLQSAGTAGRQVVVAGSDVADLPVNER